MSHKFAPMYPVLFAAEGERCEKMQYRTGGRVHLRCVRRVHGAEARHLFDIQDRDAIEGSRPAPKAI